jgi:hypothetical protein
VLDLVVRDPFDTLMLIVATGALGLVVYLAWARARLRRLSADEAGLSEEEIARIASLAEELVAERARRGVETSVSGS